jgi:hypothetical protein
MVAVKTKRKIGFILEGDSDRIIVETLARRILSQNVGFDTVRLGGIAALPSAYTTVLLFLDNDYHHVVLVIDADSRDESEYAWRKQSVEESLQRYHVLEEVTICTAVPSIEAWLLAEYEPNPEQVANPKIALATHLGLTELSHNVIATLAQQLNIEKAKKRSKSFNNFVSKLRAVERAITVENKVVPISQT